MKSFRTNESSRPVNGRPIANKPVERAKACYDETSAYAKGLEGLLHLDLADDCICELTGTELEVIELVDFIRGNMG